MAGAAPAPSPSGAIMTPFVSFPDVLSDSPRFRARLSSAEASLDDLEGRLERVLKASAAASEAGRTFVGQQTQFLASLWELSSHFASSASSGAASSASSSAEAASHLNRLIHALQEIVKLQGQLVEQSGRVLSKGLTKFLR